MKRIKKSLVGILVLAAMLLIPVLALADSTATITGDGVNIRTGPSTAYQSVGKLYKGNTVTVSGQSGSWSKVKTSAGTEGYVFSQYVSVNTSSDTDGSDSSTGGNSQSGTTNSSTLQKGSTGAAVKQLQGNLIMLGYLKGSADGIFGSNTESAVRLYQRRNGMTADGVAGTKTRTAVGNQVVRINTIISTAKKYLGTAYVYGGSTPATGFDCSGLTQYAFGKAGVTIPRVSYEQAKSGISVPKSQLRVGDLVAFNSPVSHVGIYVGNNQFIHSPKTGDVVKITNLKYMNLTAIRRHTGVLANG